MSHYCSKLAIWLKYSSCEIVPAVPISLLLSYVYTYEWTTIRFSWLIVTLSPLVYVCGSWSFECGPLEAVFCVPPDIVTGLLFAMTETPLFFNSELFLLWLGSSGAALSLGLGFITLAACLFLLISSLRCNFWPDKWTGRATLPKLFTSCFNYWSTMVWSRAALSAVLNSSLPICIGTEPIVWYSYIW